MKVIVVATGNFNQKTSCVIPQLPLDYLFTRLLSIYC